MTTYRTRSPQGVKDLDNMAYPERNTTTPEFEQITPSLITKEDGGLLLTEDGKGLIYEGPDINDWQFNSRNTATPSYAPRH